MFITFACSEDFEVVICRNITECDLAKKPTKKTENCSRCSYLLDFNNLFIPLPVALTILHGYSDQLLKLTNSFLD